MLPDQVPYFILDLLQQTSAVHVKGLGRFEAIFHPAVVDLPGSRIKPPYVQPDFNEQDIEGDALLVKYIEYAIGAPRAEIENAIDAFVNEIKHTTDNGENYIVEQFGSFSKNASGTLRFTPDWDAFNLSFSGLEVIDLKPKVESVEHKVFAPEELPVELVTVPVSNELTDIQKEQKEISTPVFINPVETKEVEETKTKPVPEYTPVESRPPMVIDESTSRLWWTILTSALVLITILCAYLAWDILSNRQKLKEYVTVLPDTSSISTNPSITIIDSSNIDVEPEPVPDTQITDETPVDPEPSKPDPVQSTPVQPDPGTLPVTTNPDRSFCYVVVGAFKDASNIARMEERIKSMGLEVEKIGGGSLTRVAIKTSCEKQSLQQTLADAKANLNPEAWIY